MAPPIAVQLIGCCEQLSNDGHGAKGQPRWEGMALTPENLQGIHASTFGPLWMEKGLPEVAKQLKGNRCSLVAST